MTEYIWLISASGWLLKRNVKRKSNPSLLRLVIQ